MDRYIGVPGEGPVVHLICGLDDALGTDDVVRVTDLPPGEGGGSPFFRLITLGLAPNPARRPTQIEVPSVGQLDNDVDPRGFGPSIPYEPADRLSSGDGYWAAKRIASLSDADIALAIEAGRFSDRRARQMMQDTLEARRARVVRYWFGRVTPVELTKLDGVKLELRDQAIRYGFARPETTDYYVDFLTSDGVRIGDNLDLHPRGDEIEVAIPQDVVATARDYLVVRVIARRDFRRAPRALAVHFRIAGGKLSLVGLRH
jgi:hypothetical protein